MSNDQNPPVWTDPVIRFIKDSLPVLDPRREEWDQMCATAFQFGCEALIALGQAKKTGRARGRLICTYGGCLHCIGKGVSERIYIVPAQFRAIVTRRPKYASGSCTDGVVHSAAPALLMRALCLLNITRN